MYQNVFTPLQNIKRPKVRPGGYCWLVYTPFENVQQWPSINPATGQAATPIVLKPGKQWYQAEVVDKDRFFREEPDINEIGPLWNQSITGYIGGNNSNQTLNAGVMPYHRYAIMLKDRDGQIRLIGNEDSGAVLIPRYTSGEFDTSRRWDYQFNWQHTNPAAIYIGDTGSLDLEEINPPFTGQGSFNNDFNSDFDI